MASFGVWFAVKIFLLKRFFDLGFELFRVTWWWLWNQLKVVCTLFSWGAWKEVRKFMSTSTSRFLSQPRRPAISSLQHNLSLLLQIFVFSGAFFKVLPFNVDLHGLVRLMFPLKPLHQAPPPRLQNCRLVRGGKQQLRLAFCPRKSLIWQKSKFRSSGKHKYISYSLSYTPLVFPLSLQ